MNGYICFYKDKKVEVESDTSYNAQREAKPLFQKMFPRNTVKGHEIAVKLAEKDGKQVTTHVEGIDLFDLETKLHEDLTLSSEYESFVKANLNKIFNKTKIHPEIENVLIQQGLITKSKKLSSKAYKLFPEYKTKNESNSNVLNTLRLLEGASKVTIEKSQGEYRVPAADGYEDGAHYTDDKEDAIAVAKKVFGDEVVITYRSVSEFVGGKYEKYRPTGKKVTEGLDEAVQPDLGKCPECGKPLSKGIKKAWDGYKKCDNMNCKKYNVGIPLKEGIDWKNTGVCPKCKGTDVKTISMGEKQCNSCKHKWSK